MADSSSETKAPQDREKAISAAYLRTLGASQADTAKQVGIGERTLRRWEDCSWWPEIRHEAMDRWLAGTKSRAMVALGHLLDGLEPTTVRFTLERLMEEFEPPRQRSELSTPPGQPLQFEDVGDAELEERHEQLRNRLIATGVSTNGNGSHP